MKNRLSYKELEKIVKHIGETYKKAVLKWEINSGIMQINENSNIYKNDKDFIFAIDCYLNECSRDTKCIIQNEYLKKNDSLWYLDYYTKSTYYRLKKKAIFEFINCMNL